MSSDPVGMDYAVPADNYTCSFETLLSEPLCAVMDDMTCQERIEALSGTVYDYDDVIDNQPGSFDYDDQCDYEEWCGWNDPADATSPGYYDYDDPRDYEDWCDRDDPDEGEGYDDPFWPLRTGPVSMVALMCLVLLERMIIMLRLRSRCSPWPGELWGEVCDSE